MSSTIRQERVAGLLFQELSILVGGELADPKLTMARVTHVTVSKDLRNVKVFVSHDDDEVSPAEVVEHLRRATPFLRSEIASRCSLRAVPELLFVYDDMPQKAARVDELLQQIAQERAERAEQDEENYEETGQGADGSQQENPNDR